MVIKPHMSKENQNKQEFVAATKSIFESMTSFFDSVFNKSLPKLPKELLDFLVKNMPIFNIIGIVLKVIAILSSIISLFGALSYILIFSNFSSTFGLLTIIYLISILLAIAGPSIALFFAIKAHLGFETKKTQSWKYLYNGWLVAIIFGVLATITSYGNVASFNGSFGISSGIAWSLMVGSILFSIVTTLAVDALIL
jgi:hypothetical protein